MYKSEVARMSEKVTAVDPECIKDPTLSRNKNVRCKNRNCDSTEAVTFTNPTKERMNLIYVCTVCTYSWKKDELDQNDIVEEKKKEWEREWEFVN